MAIVAMVFSVARDRDTGGGEEGDTKDPGETAELVVVLRRKGGDYHRWEGGAGGGWLYVVAQFTQVEGRLDRGGTFRQFCF